MHPAYINPSWDIILFSYFQLHIICHKIIAKEYSLKSNWTPGWKAVPSLIGVQVCDYTKHHWENLGLVRGVLSCTGNHTHQWCRGVLTHPWVHLHVTASQHLSQLCLFPTFTGLPDLYSALLPFSRYPLTSLINPGHLTPTSSCSPASHSTLILSVPAPSVSPSQLPDCQCCYVA